MQNPKLLPQLPPFADPADPKVLAWQVATQADAIEHLHQTKLEAPSASLLRLAGVALSLILGLAGLVSPAQLAALLRALLP